MKKIAVFLLIFILLMNYAFAEDFSTKTIEELHSLQKQIRTELLKRDLVADGGTLLFEKDGISLYLTGEYEETWMGFQLSVIVINDTNYFIYVAPTNHYISINGWDVKCLSTITVNPGRKRKDSFTFILQEAGISSYSEIEEIEFSLFVYDQENHLSILSFDPIVIQFPLK